MRRGHWTLLTLLAMGLVAGGCGEDENGDIVINGPVGAPAAWVGRWAGTMEEGPCTGRLGGGAQPDTFSICENDSIASEPGIGCEATWNDTTLDFDCTNSLTLENCTFNSSISATVTRTGEQLSFVWRFEVSYTGDCGDETGSECAQSSGTYARISTTPVEAECDAIDYTPVVPRLPANPTFEDRLDVARAELERRSRAQLMATIQAAW